MLAHNTGLRYAGFCLVAKERRVNVLNRKAGAMVVFGVGLSALLAGCSIGIKPGDDSPSVSYVIPRSYQMVFLRAQNQAQECLRGKGEFVVKAQVEPTTQSAVVAVRAPLGGNDMARTEIQATDERHTQVVQTVWGHGKWNLNALHAMEQSVRSDTSMCFAYK